MIESLQDFTESLPTLLQWVGVMLASMVPFIESYGGSVIGVIAGINPAVAIAAAIVGNVASMLLFVLLTGKVHDRAIANREPKELSPRRQKLRRTFDRYGVAGVSLLGQTILPSQITSAAMVSFGAPRKVVILWQTISIILWGVAFGVLAALGTAIIR